MVHGRKGLQLEAWKFGVYLFLPIAASITFNEPRVQRYCADYFQFLKYPANPNVNLREEFEELARKREKEKEQRKAYLEEVKKMQASAAERRKLREEAAAVAANGNGGWFGWMRLRRKQQPDVDN
mmetsp:Transcript_11149/g.14075  ORF Transcript_11149/g.14075 Transcript_11149/m.14075 type:complete len:125 (-) Transcript_11149:24-398(-)